MSEYNIQQLILNLLMIEKVAAAPFSQQPIANEVIVEEIEEETEMQKGKGSSDNNQENSSSTGPLLNGTLLS